jgi:release factor glutamine methyltransferase
LQHVVIPLDVMCALEQAGVRVVRLDGPNEAVELEADLLVPRAQKQSALAALDGIDWRFEIGNRGLWRLMRRASYGWDAGLVVHLHWGLPAAPLPSRALARLERLAWARAERADDGALQLDAAVQVAVAAVQLARPQARRARWRKIAAHAASRVEDWTAVARVAEEGRVAGSVRRAVARPGATSPLPRGDSAADRAWLLARRLGGRIRSRRIQALLSGSPLLGRSVRRCRFAGIEVLAGAGVFRPMTVTEHMVEAALAALPPGAAADVIEVGTGCGAVALAIANERRDVRVHAADVSSAAVRWAKRNQQRYATRVRFTRGSLLEPFPSTLERRVAVVAGNVPYVPPALDRPATHDTPGAVLGQGDDGLGLVRALGMDARRFLRPGGRLITQMLASQWATFEAELEAMGYGSGTVAGASGPHVIVTATLR